MKIFHNFSLLLGAYEIVQKSAEIPKASLKNAKGKLLGLVTVYEALQLLSELNSRVRWQYSQVYN